MLYTSFAVEFQHHQHTIVTIIHNYRSRNVGTDRYNNYVSVLASQYFCNNKVITHALRSSGHIENQNSIKIPVTSYLSLASFYLLLNFYIFFNQFSKHSTVPSGDDSPSDFEMLSFMQSAINKQEISMRRQVNK